MDEIGSAIHVNQTSKTVYLLPVGAILLCGLAFACWTRLGVPPEEIRKPKTWNRTGAMRKELQGGEQTALGPGKPSALPGEWPWFRGPRRDNIVASPLPAPWPANGPKVLWRIPAGEGHAGATVRQGRVYLIDYDREKVRDAIRCLSLDDGKEIWRTSYPVDVKRNHGMSRTVPAVTDKFVVTIGPKHHVYCCDTATGRVIWKKNFIAEFGTADLPWYAGQCPYIDGDRVILAPAAKPLMMAVDLATGRELWRTQTHENLGITHSSIATMDFDGKKQYLYCTKQGVVGVDAADGKVLWLHKGWTIKIATVATPLVIDHERVFFSGGYSSGCEMVKLVKEGGGIKAQELWRLKAAVWGADQQTPVLFQDHIYGTIPPLEHGELGCLDLTGKRLWTSGVQYRFGLGPFMMFGDGRVLALSDQEGTLYLGQASPAGFKELAKAKLLNGHDAWGPMALAGNRLILRDLTEMICVELAS